MLKLNSATYGNATPYNQNYLDTSDQMPQDYLFQASEGTNKSENYLVNFREFIAEFLSLSTEIAETDRQKTNDLKKQYLEATANAAGSIRSKGFYEIAFSVASVAVFALSVFTRSSIDKEMIQLTVKEILPGVKNLMLSRIDADARTIEAKQLILGNEHQAKVTKAASDSGKQEFMSALREAFQSASVR